MLLDQSPWYVAGPLIGLGIVGLRFALNKPFGALGGFIDVAEQAANPQRLGFRSFMLIGLILGGFLFAFVSGSFALTITYGGASGIVGGQIALLLGAGVMMGIGARTAGGCTSGHGMSGMSIGSPASLAATMTFFATAVILAHILAGIGGGA